MAKNNDLFERSFKVLEQSGKPTEQQKEMMLNHILTEYKAERASGVSRLRELIVAYPWRFAFSASAVQAIVFTMIFGTGYTNMFLNFFGG